MEPRPNLQRMAVCERVPVSIVSLRADLDLLFQAELSSERKLPGKILEGPGTGLNICPFTTGAPNRSNATADARLGETPCPRGDSLKPADIREELQRGGAPRISGCSS
jgi:hypothetical protein